MSCNIETVASAPCGLTYNSSRIQLESLVLLLCSSLDALGGTVNCADPQSILDDAQASGLTCVSPGQAKAKFAQIVAEGLDVELSSLSCFSVQDLEAMKLYLTCSIINTLNP